MCDDFPVIQSGEKNIVYRMYYLIPFIAGEVGCEETGNWEWKGLLYNLQSVSRVTQQHYYPLHPWWFRSYKQKPEEKMDDQPVPSIVLYGGRQVRCRERINQSPLSQSLSYRKAAGWESGARGRHHLPYESCSGPLLTITGTRMHTDSTHTMNKYIQAQHTHRHTLPHTHQ